MSRARVAVLSVITKQMSVTAAAAEYGYSRRQLHRLLARYRAGGLDAVDPRSRRPASNPAATPDTVRERIIELRLQLAKDGLDAGPVTLAWHLEQEGHQPPSTSTIRRILHTAGLVVPEPRKRPRSSYHHFVAAQPNECWQSDFTHWRLADGTDAEILNWLDDHSRYLLGSTAHRPVTGPIVVAQFKHVVAAHGLPASMLTDNGLVYTTRFAGGRRGKTTRNGFETELARLGVQQKNSSPNHPQTCGKIERFHQTQKKWLAKQPRARTLAELQAQLDTFRSYYNDQRPHRALQRRTPAAAYTSRPKATPTGVQPSHERVRRDRIDDTGAVTLRHHGKLHHIGIGRTHARTHVLLLIQNLQIRVINAQTGELLRDLVLDPTRDYQPRGLPPGPKRTRSEP
jgi:transposase InsO family protein